MIQTTKDNFSEIYNYINNCVTDLPNYLGKCRLGNFNEILGVQFLLTNPLDNLCNKTNEGYAKDFYNWMMSGKDTLQPLIDQYPHVSKFSQDGNISFSTFYGPRILSQIDDAIDSLKYKRRSVIHILLPKDKEILKIDTNQEYPCAKDIQLLERYGHLHMYVSMRSNNSEHVLPYDVYNFTRLQEYISIKSGLKLGHYYHSAVSMHKFINK